MATTNDSKELKPKKKVHPYNSYNPFIEKVTEHITDCKRRKVAGWKWQDVKVDDQIVSQPMLVLGDVQQVDKQEYYKIYKGELKSFFGLTANSMNLFQYMLDSTQYHKDKVCINAHIVKSEINMAESTMHRAINQLLDRKIIARASMPGCYYINPAIAFKGSRLTLIKQFIVEMDSRPGAGIYGRESPVEIMEYKTPKEEPMITKIGGHIIRYEWEGEVNPKELQGGDIEYIGEQIAEGYMEGQIVWGDEVVGNWEIIESAQNNPR